MRKQRYWLYRRAGIYYLHDAETGKRESLNTHNKREAEQIRIVRNEVAARPQVGWALAKACFAAQDSKVLKRTWQDVIEEFCSRGKSQTQTYRRRVVSRTPFNQLQHKKLIETTADDIMGFLKAGGAQTHLVLRCLHNLAVGLGWLPWPILANKLWPKIQTKNKRGITWDEHRQIIGAEQNLERRLYYEVLWETGASQTDAVLLHAQSIDWEKRIISYQRQKTEEWAHLRIGTRLEQLLQRLPTEGPLFPRLAKSTNSARAAEFCRRCRILGIEGISLHSYRYAWAERARASGYPERWAQNALGHNSRAVHQAYARGGVAICPPLDEFEIEVRKRNGTATKLNHKRINFLQEHAAA